MKPLAAALAAALLLSACGASPGAQQPAPTVAPATQAAATPAAPAPAPTAAPTAVPTPDPAALQPTWIAELSATALALLPPTATPVDASDYPTGFTGITTLPLQTPAGSPALAALYPTGLRDFKADTRHFVAVYERAGDAWHELARAELPDADGLQDGSVSQVDVLPGEVWLRVDAGAGAHSGVFTLLRLAGRTLSTEAAAFHSSPVAADLKDLDADGVPEVLVNRTDVYLFCYACGVRKTDYGALQWDGGRFVERGLAPLPADTPAALREPLDRAISLAQAGLYKDAAAALAPALAQPQTPESRWNAGLLAVLIAARADQAASGAYPLLDNLFYGDYAAALAPMRGLTPAAIFGSPSALVAGTIAEGWEEPLTASITSTTELALRLDPNLAAAHFLRGWALHLADPASPEAVTEIERAAQLAPEDALFTESLAYLRQR
jgi:hypothetical protein